MISPSNPQTPSQSSPSSLPATRPSSPRVAHEDAQQRINTPTEESTKPDRLALKQRTLQQVKDALEPVKKELNSKSIIASLVSKRNKAQQDLQEKFREIKDVKKQLEQALEQSEASSDACQKLIKEFSQLQKERDTLACAWDRWSLAVNETSANEASAPQSEPDGLAKSQTNESVFAFTALPTELQLSIVSLLDLETQKAFARTSTHGRALATSPSTQLGSRQRELDHLLERCMISPKLITDTIANLGKQHKMDLAIKLIDELVRRGATMPTCGEDLDARQQYMSHAVDNPASFYLAFKSQPGFLEMRDPVDNRSMFMRFIQDNLYSTPSTGRDIAIALRLLKGQKGFDIDPNALDRRCGTLLVQTITNCQFDIVHALLDLGADPLAKDIQDWNDFVHFKNPLQFVEQLIANPHPSKISYLREIKAHMDQVITNKKGSSLFRWVSYRP